MSQPEPIGDIVNRVVARSAAKWEHKNATEQTSQRIDEIAVLAIPVFNALMAGDKPPYPPDGALAALRDVYNRGWAPDLDDPVLRNVVKGRLEAHWQTVLAQREAAHERKPRARDESRWGA